MSLLKLQGNDSIILHIHPLSVLFTQQNKDITLGQTAINTPIHSFYLLLAVPFGINNIVRARNGQFIVIGGLMQNNMVEEVAGIPGVSRIPFVGAFFRRTYQIAQKVNSLFCSVQLSLKAARSGLMTWKPQNAG